MESSREKSHTQQVKFSSPRKLGRGKGSGLSIELPFSATEYLSKVNSILESEEDREKLFAALKVYHENHRVKKLVKDLMVILDTPKKYPLFNEIRNLIPPEHVFSYDKLTEGAKTGERLVVVKRQGNDPFGFHLRGGKEHGCGIFVTAISDGSPAVGSGLKVGDEILRINRLLLTECIHEEVINILKSRKVVTLVVRFMAQVPVKVENQLRWTAVETLQKDSPTKDNGTQRDRLLAFKISKEGLGCTIRPGIPNHDGCYVSAVNSGSLAEQVGLRVGDQIFDVNGKNFNGIKQAEAIQILKSKTQLTMVVRHNPKAKEYFEKKEKAKRDKKEKSKDGILLSILKKQSVGPTSPNSKHANFGDELMVQIIEAPDSDPNDDIEDLPLMPHPSNLNYDSKVIGDLEPNFLSIPKTAGLMIDIAQREHRIIVTSVAPNGAAAEHGFMKRGDWILNVEGTSLIGSRLEEAEETLREAMSRLARQIDIVIACQPGRVVTHAPAPVPQKHTPEKSQSDNESDAEADKVRSAVAVFESLKNGQSQPSGLTRRDSLDKMKNNVKVYQTKKQIKDVNTVENSPESKRPESFPANNKTFSPRDLEASSVVDSVSNQQRTRTRSITYGSSSELNTVDDTVTNQQKTRTRSVTIGPTSPGRSAKRLSSPVKFVPIPSSTTVLIKGELSRPVNVQSDMSSSYMDSKTIFRNSRPPSVEYPSPSHSIQSASLIRTSSPTSLTSPSSTVNNASAPSNTISPKRTLRHRETTDLSSIDVRQEDILQNASVQPPPPLPNTKKVEETKEFTNVKSFWKDAEMDESEEETDGDPFMETPIHRPVPSYSASSHVPRIASTVTHSPLYVSPQQIQQQKQQQQQQFQPIQTNTNHFIDDQLRNSASGFTRLPSHPPSNTASGYIDPNMNTAPIYYNPPSQTYPYSNNLQRAPQQQQHVPIAGVNTVTGLVQERPRYTTSQMHPGNAPAPRQHIQPAPVVAEVPTVTKIPTKSHVEAATPTKSVVRSARINTDPRVAAIQNRMVKQPNNFGKEREKISLDDLLSKDTSPTHKALDSEVVNASEMMPVKQEKQMPIQDVSITNITASVLSDNRRPKSPPVQQQRHQQPNRADNSTPRRRFKSPPPVNSPSKPAIKQTAPATNTPRYLPSYQKGVSQQGPSIDSTPQKAIQLNESFSWLGSSSSDGDKGTPVIKPKSLKPEPTTEPVASPSINERMKFLGEQSQPPRNDVKRSSSFNKKLNRSQGNSKKVTFQTEGLKDESLNEPPPIDPVVMQRRAASVANGVQAVEQARKLSSSKSPSSVMRQSMFDLRSTNPTEAAATPTSAAVPINQPKQAPQSKVDNGNENSVVFMDNNKSSHFLSSLNAMLGGNAPPPAHIKPEQKQEARQGPSAIPKQASISSQPSVRPDDSNNKSVNNNWDMNLPPRDYGMDTNFNDKADEITSVTTQPTSDPSIQANGISDDALKAGKNLLRSSKSPAPVRNKKVVGQPKGAPPIDNIVDELKNKVFKNDKKFAKYHQVEAKQEDVMMQQRPMSNRSDLSEMNASLQELDNVIRSLDDDTQH